MTPRAAHGNMRGYDKHRRAGEDPCDLCKAAKSGYEQGKRARHILAPPLPASLPDELTEALLRACRAIVLRQPPGSQLVGLARHALQVADARRNGNGGTQ